MDLSKLKKSEAVAARVYIRNRRKAWNHFYFLQDLKSGTYITGKGGVYFINSVQEDFDCSPLDIVIVCTNVISGEISHFGFSIRAFESGFMTALLRWHNRGIKNSYEQQFKLSEGAQLIYEKT